MSFNIHKHAYDSRCHHHQAHSSNSNSSQSWWTHRQTDRQSNNDERKNFITLKHLNFSENFSRSTQKKCDRLEHTMEKTWRCDDVSTQYKARRRQIKSAKRKHDTEYFHQMKCTRTDLTLQFFFGLFFFCFLISSSVYFVQTNCAKKIVKDLPVVPDDTLANGCAPFLCVFNYF